MLIDFLFVLFCSHSNGRSHRPANVDLFTLSDLSWKQFFSSYTNYFDECEIFSISFSFGGQISQICG